MTIKGLSSDQSETLRQTILQRESSGNYQAVNQLGYIGGYQMGAAALEDLGYLKKGASAGGNSALNNPSNWNLPGGKEAFLSNPAIQDQAFERLSNMNYNTLSKKGVVGADTSSGDVAGYLAASHLTGPGGAAKLARGEISSDANGVTASEYFSLGKSRVTGAATGPISAISGNKFVTAAKLPQVMESSQLPAFSGKTGVGDVVEVDGVQNIGSEATVPKGPIKNPLERFSSFNSIFTFSCLNSKKVNFPDAADSYKAGNFGSIIFRSGGGYPENRVSTAYTSAANPGGKFEYYIDNVEIESVMAFNKKTKGTNSTNITFTVFEPYSMGLFLQSMQIAAKENGYSNYIEAPFLLTIQFIGYDSDGNPVPVDDVLDRHIPLKIGNATMEVKASGCEYQVEAYPWNEQALTDMHNLLKEDMNISGKDVGELLQSGKNSLQYWINTKLQDIAKTATDAGRSSATPDEVVIIFPKVRDSANSELGKVVSDRAQSLTTNLQSKVSGATGGLIGNAGNNANNSIESKLTLTRGANALLIQTPDSLNEIGKSLMGFTNNTGGDSPVVDRNKTQPDPTKPVIRQSNSYDPKSKTFRFPQNTSIVNAITEIVLMSEYCKQSATAPSNSRGMKKWFRIETQVYDLKPTQTNESRAKVPKLMVFRVVPYYVHESRFAAPTSEPKGYEQLKKDVCKEYNYIYTGKNVDILNFNIRLEAGFYTTVYADKNAYSPATQQNKGAGVEKGGAPSTGLNPGTAQDTATGNAMQGTQPIRDKNSGGGPADDFRSLIAKNFQEALLNSPADLITAELEIMGDPYYIADSGMGNFSDKPANFNLNSNGSMNYQSGEVDILINFKTPVDYNTETGFVDFGSAQKVEGFSGLYQVLTVKNSFRTGKFTQTLDIVRRRNQDPKASALGSPGSISGIVGSIQGQVQGALSNVQGQVQSAVTNVQGAVIGSVNSATSAAKGIVGNGVNVIKDVIDTSTGGSKGSISVTTPDSSKTDSDSAKPLAVNPNEKEKTALDSTSNGYTTDQIDFGNINPLAGWF